MITSNEMRFYGLGILALGALAAAACSSSSGTSTGGGATTSSTTSSSSSTTTSSGVGGSTSSSTSSSTTASSSSSTTTTSSSSGAAGCTMSDAPPSATILAAGDGGLSVFGGITTYGGTAAPTAATTASGNLTITESGTGSATAAQYVGAVVYFSGNSTGTDCIKGTAYTGVEFTLSGSVTGCTVVFTINDSEHSAVSATDPKASGAAGSYPGTVPLTPTSTATMVKVPFTGTGAPTGGMPATAIDSTKLESISWQYVIPMGTATCTSSLTIDNIAFY